VDIWLLDSICLWFCIYGYSLSLSLSFADFARLQLTWAAGEAAGPAASYAILSGNPLVGALWGIIIWKELKVCYLITSCAVLCSHYNRIQT
jgi:hypothetical protein